MDDIATWHPKVAALHVYWQGLAHGPGRLPARVDIGPASIPTLLPNTFLLDVLEAPLRFRYRLVGSKLVSAGGRELTRIIHRGADIGLADVA